MFAFREAVAGATLAVTDRHGGVSDGVFASLNLADHVGDDPAAVAENRRRVAEAIGVRPTHLVFARQVHGRRVAVVDAPWTDQPAEADALVTTVPGIALGVLVADCTPVMLAAVGVPMVGVAHTGRRGMVDGACKALVTVMRRLGADELVARVGPAICPRCYSVPLGLREEVADREPVTRSVDRHGGPSLDVTAGVLSQLAPLCSEVLAVNGCNCEDADLYSYRRQRTTGRYAGLAWLPAP